MNGLLKACYGSPSHMLFVESYLRMVQRLLETNKVHFEKLATDLFVRFSTIQEDSPAYYKQYEFFICKFSSMCYASRGKEFKIQRFNGLRGLRALIWKAGANKFSIWEKVHMDKIIPAILYNFPEEKEDFEIAEPSITTAIDSVLETDNASSNDAFVLAITCLRELMSKATVEALTFVLQPVMVHCDAHNKWNPTPIFALSTFRIITFSIVTEHASFVIQELINYLNIRINAEASIRIGIATVLQATVSIAATSIGPLIFGIFNSLLKILRFSINFELSNLCRHPREEKLFQKVIIDTLADFSKALPDYQKAEIMLFIVSNLPIETSDTMEPSDDFMRKILVKTLLKIVNQGTSRSNAMSLPESFWKAILKLCVTSDQEIKQDAHEILHILLNRYDNLKRLSRFENIENSDELEMSITDYLSENHDEEDHDDILSFSSSSIEWTPPGTPASSRRNAANDGEIFEDNQENIEESRMELPQIEPFEKDEEKTREVVNMFRGRSVDELSNVLVENNRKLDRAQLIDNLCKHHKQGTLQRQVGPFSHPKTIFEINFPSFVD